MARPLKIGLDYFPQWNPQFRTIFKFLNSSETIRFAALRNSSSAFIKRMDVREQVFKRDDYTCVQCKGTYNLQVDHIVSVYTYAKNKIIFNSLNSEVNLQTLCCNCNSGKLP